MLVCGDIESNPGPSGFLVSVVCVVGILYLCQPVSLQNLDLSEIGCIVSYVTSHTIVQAIISAASTTVRFVVSELYDLGYLLLAWPRMWLNNTALNCAYLEFDREMYKNCYLDSFCGPWAMLFSSIGWAPGYAQVVERDHVCEAVFSYWDKPIITVRPWRLLTVITYVSYAIAVLMVTVIICCVTVTCYFMTRGRGITKVVNNQNGLEINKIKDSFRSLSKTMPNHVVGQHNILAYQRRAAESFCFEKLLDCYPRVRDVGGSRSRWPELAYAKHVCGPILSNSDILRTEKGRGVFENCGVAGQFCPLRREIPAAVLSHVDYHMTHEQLCCVVTGPTFVINHDFNIRGSGGR